MNYVTSPATDIDLSPGALRVKDPIVPQLLMLLRAAIVELRLLPGEALSEKDIANRFAVSRQPVREAFIKLAELGLVEIRPSRGTYVTRISVRDVINARFVREAVECDIAAAAARLAGKTDIANLRALIHEQKEAATAADHRRFNDRDQAFHHTIARIVDCDYAWRTVETARFYTDRVRLLSIPGTSTFDTLIAQHAQLADAIEARSPERAQKAMRRHLREILVALPRIAETYPNYFSDTKIPAHSADIV